MSRPPAAAESPDGDEEAADKVVVERELDDLKGFVSGLSDDEIRSGGWFAKLLTHALGSYTDKVDWHYFQKRYHGVPADAIVDQRIKMASRYAQIGGGLSAGAYTLVIAATIGTRGGSSRATVPAAATTILADVALITQLQVRLAYDIAVLYRIPLDPSDPDDLWKLIRVAFMIRGGEVVREGVLKGVPPLLRPVIKRYYSGAVLNAAKGLPVVGKHLLQRNVIKVGIPLVGVPLSVLVNRYTTLVIGRHAQDVFRDEARVIELAENLSERSQHPRLTLWVSWLVVMADDEISDNEALLMRQLVVFMKERHDVADEKLARVVEFDPEDVWRLLDVEAADVSGLAAEARQVAGVDGSINDRELAVITELEERCSPARRIARPEPGTDIR